MPGGYTIAYPDGRSGDQDGQIRLDSRDGVGGVRPTRRIPKTVPTILAYAAHEDVELGYAVDFLNGETVAAR